MGSTNKLYISNIELRSFNQFSQHIYIQMLTKLFSSQLLMVIPGNQHCPNLILRKLLNQNMLINSITKYISTLNHILFYEGFPTKNGRKC